MNPNDLDKLIDRYCDAWSEADPSKRTALLESVWAPEATYSDPTVERLNITELAAHIAKVQATRPGAQVRRATMIDSHHGAARFGFEVLGQDGSVLRKGIDFVLLDHERARIQRIIGFFGELASSEGGS